MLSGYLNEICFFFHQETALNTFFDRCQRRRETLEIYSWVLEHFVETHLFFFEEKERENMLVHQFTRGIRRRYIRKFLRKRKHKNLNDALLAAQCIESHIEGKSELT